MEACPLEIIANICKYIGIHDIYNFALTSKRNYEIVKKYIIVYLKNIISEKAKEYKYDINIYCDPIAKLLDHSAATLCYNIFNKKVKIYSEIDSHSLYGPDYELNYDSDDDGVNRNNLYIWASINRDSTRINKYIYRGDYLPSQISKYNNIKILSWYIDSHLHRNNDLPAYMFSDTDMNIHINIYFTLGNVNRIRGPAYIYSGLNYKINGYYMDSMPHRDEDGRPAYIMYKHDSVLIAYLMNGKLYNKNGGPVIQFKSDSLKYNIYIKDELIYVEKCENKKKSKMYYKYTITLDYKFYISKYIKDQPYIISIEDILRRLELHRINGPAYIDATKEEWWEYGKLVKVYLK